MKSNCCLILVVFAVFIAVQQAKSETCLPLSGKGTINTTTFKLGPNCFNFTNTIPKLIQLKNVVLNDNDNITIQDNDKPIVSWLLPNRVPFQVVIGLENTTIQINAAKNTSFFGMEISYSDDLIVDITNTMTTTLYSPMYAPLVKRSDPIKCRYTVTNSFPSGTIAAVSVVNYQLDSSSNFIIKNYDQNSTVTNSTAPDDFFTSSEDQKIVVELNFNAKAQQEFVLSVEPVIKVCSGVQKLATPASVVKLFDQQPDSKVPYKCRILLVSSSQTITIKVDKLDFASGQDLMTIREGSSSRDQISRYFYTDLENSELFISSSKSVLVTLEIGAPTRNKNISVTAELGLGEKFLNSSELSMPKANATVTRYWQLTAEAGKLVKVNVIEIAEAQATFYDGFQPSGKKITVISKGNVYVNPVIGDSDMLVMVEGTNLTKDFNASFSSVDKDCDHFSSDVSGTHSLTPSGNKCTCSIYPYNEEPASNFNYIILYIDTITLNDKETVQVESGQNNIVLAKFEKSVSQYQVIGSFKDGLRVVFTRDGELKKNTQVSFHYESVSTVCGGNLTTEGKPYDLSTPNYPDQYPLNAECVWSVVSKEESKQLLINVDALNLAGGHSLTVSTDNVFKANYTGTKVPGSSLLVNANETKIEFHSQGPSTSVASGAKFTYQSYDCGYNWVGREGNISLGTLQQGDCLWVIKVQENTTLSVVNVSLSPDNKANLSSLVIYDGPSIESDLLKFNMNASVLSKYNTIIVQAKPLTVNLTLLFTAYDCLDKCQNGLCMHPNWKCDGKNDCGDNTDEINCGQVPVVNTTTAAPITTSKPETADYSGWVKSGWVPACLAIGIILGMVLYFMVPKIVRKIRGRGGNYSRMGDDRM